MTKTDRKVRDVIPPSPDYRIHDLGASLRIALVLSHRRYLLLERAGNVLIISMVTLESLFFLGWAWKLKLPDSFIYYILAPLSLALGFLLKFLVRHFLLTEEFGVESEGIVVTYRILGFLLPFRLSSQRYLAEHVVDLRPLLVLTGKLWSKAIAFDYGARTYRFGAGLDEAEANQIVAAIVRKFPQYASGPNTPARPLGVPNRDEGGV